MLEVAEIIRLHGAAYLARFADRILPSHRRALRDHPRAAAHFHPRVQTTERLALRLLTTRPRSLKLQ